MAPHDELTNNEQPCVFDDRDTWEAEAEKRGLIVQGNGDMIFASNRSMHEPDPKGRPLKHYGAWVSKDVGGFLK